MGKLFEELKRRKVFRVAAVYAVVSWVLIQVADNLVPALQLPAWTNSFIVLLLLLGFPIALVLAWAYEVTPEGVKSDTPIHASTQIPAPQNQNLIYAMFVLLLVAVGFQITDRFIFEESPVNDTQENIGNSDSKLMQLSITMPEEFSYRVFNGSGHGLALSPDGSQVVFTGIYNGSKMLIHRALDRRVLTPLPGTENPNKPFFSSDGESVAFFTNNGSLKRVTLDGRPAVTISDIPDKFSVGLWTDSEIYFTGTRSERTGGLYKTSGDGGPVAEIPLDQIGQSGTIAAMSFIKATGEILLGSFSAGASTIYALDAGTGETQTILDDAYLVSYLDAGLLVFARDGNVMAARFDAATRRVGSVVPVLEGSLWSATGAVPQVIISPSGTLAFAVEPSVSSTAKLNWVDSNGSRSSIGELSDASSAVRLSPDGRLAVIASDTIPALTYLWDMVLQVPFGLEIEGARFPSWHPDGKHIVFVSSGEVVRLNIEDGSEEALFSLPRGSSALSLASDGETLVFNARDETGRFGIYARLPGETAPRTIITSEQNFYNPVVSPNGQWVAYDSFAIDSAGSVFVARFPSGTDRRRVSVLPSYQPQWRSDGKALFFTAGGTGESHDMQMVEAESDELLAFGPPTTLFNITAADDPERSSTFFNYGASYQPSPDGDRFLMIYRAANGRSNELVIAPNWIMELERLLPSEVF